MTALVWDCAHCGQPIDDGDGWLQCHYREVWQAAEKRRREAGPAGQLVVRRVSEIPVHPRARWVTIHRACDTNPDPDCCWYAIERVRTETDLIHRTAHLMGKVWLRYTDWQAVLYRAVAQREVAR